MSLKSCHQAIAIHTFCDVQFGSGTPRNVHHLEPIALGWVGLLWLFVILFVAIGFAVHTHGGVEYYATPTPVRTPYMASTGHHNNYLISDSTGVGLARDSMPKELQGNMPGSGSHYLAPFSCMVVCSYSILR